MDVLADSLEDLNTQTQILNETNRSPLDILFWNQSWLFTDTFKVMLLISLTRIGSSF